MKSSTYNDTYLDYASTFVDGIGPDKSIFAPSPDALDKVAMAKSRGLYIHPYTFRADDLIEPEFDDNFDNELVSSNLYIYYITVYIFIYISVYIGVYIVYSV